MTVQDLSKIIEDGNIVTVRDAVKFNEWRNKQPENNKTVQELYKDFLNQNESTK